MSKLFKAVLVVLLGATALLVLARCDVRPPAGEQVIISLVTDRDSGAPAMHGAEKLVSALRAKGIRTERVGSVADATGKMLIVVGVVGKGGGGRPRRCFRPILKSRAA